MVSRIDYGFIRQALINGLEYQEKLGVNPFKYGIVAGADAHSTFSINEEFNFTGPHGVSDANTQSAPVWRGHQHRLTGHNVLFRRHDRRVGAGEYPRGRSLMP